MQTLKTAAIVVLLMTVMYGAYVSLTTPPEPRPADVQNVLQFDEEGTLAIDVGLPESLGELEINAGIPTTRPDSATESTGSMSLASLELPAEGSDSANVASGPAVSGAAVLGSQNAGVTTTLTDATSATSPDYVDLSSATEVAGASSVATPRSYPTTGNTFELPDPNSVVSSFNASESTTDPTPHANLALTSGTSDAPSLDAHAHENGASQIPSLDTDASIGTPNLGLTNAIRSADKQYAADKRKDALATLSIFYNTPNLSGEQRSELLARLDPLARDVIYSTRHLLEMPHRVGHNETLMEVAARYEVPWQLLANINQIKDPLTVLPGTELKVVRGPFRAEVNLTLKELTLFLGDLYAGRFPIGIGNDPPPKPGTFTVQDKQTERTYYDPAGAPVPSGSPANPYGNAWIDLGGQLCIHGSPSTTSPTEKGCISLAADYADDLYGILSQGSSVTIRR